MKYHISKFVYMYNIYVWLLYLHIKKDKVKLVPYTNEKYITHVVDNSHDLQPISSNLPHTYIVCVFY